MGDVIRSNAAVEDIFKDVRDSHSNGVAKGGKVKDLTEQHLGPIVAMIDATEDELETAQDELKPLAAAVKAGNDEADLAIGRIYDDTWNDVGRPQYDRHLTLMYPGGTGYYTDGDTPGQPARMELLASLYDRGLHPKLTAPKSAEYASRVRAAATKLKQAVDGAAGPAAKTALLQRVRTALGRTAQFELANLKRSFKNASMSEKAIHEIIPDRPGPKKTAKKAGGKKGGGGEDPPA